MAPVQTPPLLPTANYYYCVMCAKSGSLSHVADLKKILTFCQCRNLFLLRWFAAIISLLKWSHGIFKNCNLNFLIPMFLLYWILFYLTWKIEKKHTTDWSLGIIFLSHEKITLRKIYLQVLCGFEFQDLLMYFFFGGLVTHRSMWGGLKDTCINC